MQSNGAFCVRKGSGPDDPHAAKVCAWDTPVASPGGNYTAHIQTDGNFCITSKNKADWCSSGTSLPLGNYCAVSLTRNGSRTLPS